MMETAKSLVPVHSYNPVSINLQDPLFRTDSEEIKVVPLEKKEYVFLDSSSDSESSDDNDNTLNEEPEIVEKDDEGDDGGNEGDDGENEGENEQTNGIKIISIDKENLQVKDDELVEGHKESEEGEEEVKEPEEGEEEVEEPEEGGEEVKEPDKGIQKGIIQGGGDLIKNVIVSFF